MGPNAQAGRGVVVVILDFGTTRCVRNLVTASNATPLYDLAEVEATVSDTEPVLYDYIDLHLEASVTGRTNW